MSDRSPSFDADELEGKVHSLLSEALNYDDQGMALEAYRKYCDSMNALMLIIKESAKDTTNDGRQRKLSAQSVRIAQKCISRMSELVEKIESLDMTHDEIRRKLSQLNPMNTMQPSSFALEQIAEAEEYLSIAKPFIDEPAQPEPHGRNSSIVSNDSAGRSPQQVLGESAPRAKSIEPVVKPARPPSVSLNLMSARQQFENKQIRQQDPRKTELFLTEMINKRQNNFMSSRVSDFFQAVTDTVKDIQQGYKLRAEEEQWTKRLRKVLSSEDIFILDPVIGLLGQKETPVAALTQDFLKRQRGQLELFVKEYTSEDPNRSVQQSFDEVHLFSYHLVDLLKHNHPELNLGEHELNLKLTIQHFIFTTPLSTEYMTALRVMNAADDRRFLDRCCKLAWDDLFGVLGIKEKFRFTNRLPNEEFVLRDGEGLFTEAVEEIKSLSVKRTPFLKLASMLNACNSICQSVERLSQDPEGPPVEVNIGSEDLLLLFSFVLIRAQPEFIYTEFMFVSELIPEEILKGESGYVLATVQTALHHIEQL